MQFMDIGVVKALYRFPVKSMRGQELDEVHVWWHGFDGDRRYAFVKTGDTSHFPWFTGRQLPDLIRYAPYFVRPDDPIRSAVRVATPDGRDMAIDGDELRDHLVERYGSPLHLLHDGRGVFDSLALSLISLSTLRGVAERTAAPIAPSQFRANILVEAYEDVPYVEDRWLGGLLIFGARPDSARVRANRPIPRCMMINLDPETAAQDPRVLRDVVHTNGKNAAIYGSAEAPGTVRVGDVLRLGR